MLTEALYSMYVRKCCDKSKMMRFHPLRRTGLAVLPLLGSASTPPAFSLSFQPFFGGILCLLPLQNECKMNKYFNIFSGKAFACLSPVPKWERERIVKSSKNNARTAIGD